VWNRVESPVRCHGPSLQRCLCVLHELTVAVHSRTGPQVGIALGGGPRPLLFPQSQSLTPLTPTLAGNSVCVGGNRPRRNVNGGPGQKIENSSSSAAIPRGASRTARTQLDLMASPGAADMRFHHGTVTRLNKALFWGLFRQRGPRKR